MSYSDDMKDYQAELELKESRAGYFRNKKKFWNMSYDQVPPTKGGIED